MIHKAVKERVSGAKPSESIRLVEGCDGRRLKYIPEPLP